MRLVVLLAAFAYQLVALPLYSFGGVGPDFVLLSLVYLALFQQRGTSVGLALVCGLCADLLSIDPWGARAVGFVLACWVVASLARMGWGERLAGRLLFVLLASSITAAVKYGFLWGESGTENLPSLQNAGAFVLYNIVLGAPLFGLLDGFWAFPNRLRRREFFPRGRPSASTSSQTSRPASLAEGR